jgi:hypothetical protein
MQREAFLVGLTANLVEATLLSSAFLRASSSRALDDFLSLRLMLGTIFMCFMLCGLSSYACVHVLFPELEKQTIDSCVSRVKEIALNDSAW